MAATPEEFLSKILGLQPDKVRELEHLTASEMLEWTKESCPLKGMWTRINSYGKDILKLQQVEPLVAWADKWKCREFLRRATPREIYWTLNQNPYYPCIAYNVSFDACSDLGFECPDATKVAYAYVCDRLRRGNKVTAAEVSALYPEGNDGILTCSPIDLRTHPLFGLDLDRTHRRELVEKGGLEGVNEFRRAQNKLAMEDDGAYVLRKNGHTEKEEDEELIGFIKSYLVSTST